MLDKNYILSIHDGVSISTSDPLVFEKQVIYVGDFEKIHPTTGVKELEFSIDETTIDHWVATHQQLVAAGIEVPMPELHTDLPSARKSTVLELSKKPDSKGRISLFAKHRFKDVETAKTFKDAQVSLYSPPVFYHQKQTFVRPIRHIAFTDYPVISDLDPSTTIAASYRSEVKPSMSKAIAQKLGLTLAADATDAQAEEAIVTAFNAKTIAASQTPPAPAPAPADPLVLSTTRENREMKIDKLLHERRITSAKAAELKKSWAADTLSLSTESVSAWDSLYSTLKGLDPIVALSNEQTGAQNRPGEDSALVKNAKAIAAQAKV